MAPPLTVPWEGREAWFLHHPYQESNHGSLRGSPLHNCCATPAPHGNRYLPVSETDNIWYQHHQSTLTTCVVPTDLNSTFKSTHLCALHQWVHCLCNVTGLDVVSSVCYMTSWRGSRWKDHYLGPLLLLWSNQCWDIISVKVTLAPKKSQITYMIFLVLVVHNNIF